MKSMTNCYQALFAVVAFLFLPIYCMADKGFRHEAVEGLCRYTVECHYEPTQHGVIVGVEAVDSGLNVDTLYFPLKVVAYNDTFPITRINASFSPVVPGCKLSPRVIDFGPVEYVRCYSYNKEALTDLIFSEVTDSLIIDLQYTSLKSLDLKNITYIKLLGDSRYSGFYGSDSLKTLSAQKLASIPNEFLYKSRVENVSFPSATKIGYEAFMSTPLKNFEGFEVKEIGRLAFENCRDLSTAIFSDKLQKIDVTAFNNTGIRALNLFSASDGMKDSHFPGVLKNMPNLMSLQSDSLGFLGVVNPGMRFNIPNIRGISVSDTYDVSFTNLERLTELIVTNSAIDSLTIPKTLRNAYWDPVETDTHFSHEWYLYYTLQMKQSAVDDVTIDPDNDSFILKDSLILALPMPTFLYASSRPTPAHGKRCFWGLSGQTLQYWYDEDKIPVGIDFVYTDTVAIASAGFPKGEWFTPRNNRYGGVTYNCDYVNNIMLGNSFEPKGYFLTTYRRAEDQRIKVYISLAPKYVEDILNCCISPLMDFIVPKGMIGRYLAQGLPMDRTSEDPTGMLSIVSISIDSKEPTSTGTYDLYGRRISDDSNLPPGIFIVDGKKKIVR